MCVCVCESLFFQIEKSIQGLTFILSIYPWVGQKFLIFLEIEKKKKKGRQDFKGRSGCGKQAIFLCLIGNATNDWIKS